MFTHPSLQVYQPQAAREAADLAEIREAFIREDLDDIGEAFMREVR
jgi:hypothetical protein